MNIDWKDINKELIQINHLVKQNIKNNQKEHYKQIFNDKEKLSFIIFYCYWLHKKFEMSIKEAFNLLDKNQVINWYLNLVFFNKTLNLSSVKTQSNSFLKNKLLTLIDDNSYSLADAIFKLFKNE